MRDAFIFTLVRILCFEWEWEENMLIASVMVHFGFSLVPIYTVSLVENKNKNKHGKVWDQIIRVRECRFAPYPTTLIKLNLVHY